MDGKRVLVVDDEPLVREIMERCLRKLGVEVSSVASAEVALDTLRQTFYDLCFMDVRMGGMDGLTAMEQIREFSPGTRVVIMSASHLTAAEQEQIKQADSFISKPFDLGEAKAIITRLLTDR